SLGATSQPVDLRFRHWPTKSLSIAPLPSRQAQINLGARGRSGLPLRPRSKHCAALDTSRRFALAYDQPTHLSTSKSISDQVADCVLPQDVAMPLMSAGTIGIPHAVGTSFDHGAFEPKTRRVFIA